MQTWNHKRMFPDFGKTISSHLTGGLTKPSLSDSGSSSSGETEAGSGGATQFMPRPETMEEAYCTLHLRQSTVRLGDRQIFFLTMKYICWLGVYWFSFYKTVSYRIKQNIPFTSETITEVLCNTIGEKCCGSELYACKQMKTKMTVTHTKMVEVGTTMTWGSGMWGISQST